MDEKKLESVLMALNVAIQTEKDGHEFYLNASEKTIDLQGKALFTSLEADEIEHLRLLENQKKALSKEQRWLSHSEPGEEAQPTKARGAPIFSRETLTRDINAYTSELSALRMALLMEKDAVAFYSKAASETDDPDGQAMYRHLVEMEKEHQRILEEEYNALAKEFWGTMGFEPF
jgi:rubrerythrin